MYVQDGGSSGTSTSCGGGAGEDDDAAAAAAATGVAWGGVSRADPRRCPGAINLHEFLFAGLSSKVQATNPLLFFLRIHQQPPDFKKHPGRCSTEKPTPM